MLRGFLPRLLLLTVTVFGCLVVLEFAVRRLFPFFCPSAQVPFRLAAKGMALGLPMQTFRLATPKGDFDSIVRFNEDGFRDTKNLRTATAGDWFALGDSYTMGWGVAEEQRFSNLLEKALNTGGNHSRVFNIAIPDNIIGYQRLLRYAEGRDAEIHQLIVGLCMENDLRDYSDGKGGWDLVDHPEPSKREMARTWLWKHSAVYIGASYVFQRSALTRSLLQKMGIARSIDELTGKNEWNETVLNTSRDELVKLVSGRDALVLIIPSRRLWQATDMQAERGVHEAFVRMLREVGLNVLDLRPRLEEGGDPLSYYFENDSHWNARGHAVAAQELYSAIRSRVRE
jgi:hypothetical protein